MQVEAGQFTAFKCHSPGAGSSFSVMAAFMCQQLFCLLEAPSWLHCKLVQPCIGKGGERQHESKPRSVSGLGLHRPHYCSYGKLPPGPPAGAGDAPGGPSLSGWHSLPRCPGTFAR